MCCTNLWILILVSLMVVTAVSCEEGCVVRVELTDTMINVVNKDELCLCLGYERGTLESHKLSDPCLLNIFKSGEKLSISTESICSCAGYETNKTRMGMLAKEDTSSYENTTSVTVKEFPVKVSKETTTVISPPIKLVPTSVKHLHNSTLIDASISTVITYVNTKNKEEVAELSSDFITEPLNATEKSVEYKLKEYPSTPEMSSITGEMSSATLDSSVKIDSTIDDDPLKVITLASSTASSHISTTIKTEEKVTDYKNVTDAFKTELVNATYKFDHHTPREDPSMSTKSRITDKIEDAKSMSTSDAIIYENVTNSLEEDLLNVDTLSSTHHKSSSVKSEEKITDKPLSEFSMITKEVTEASSSPTDLDLIVKNYLSAFNTTGVTNKIEEEPLTTSDVISKSTPSTVLISNYSFHAINETTHKSTDKLLDAVTYEVSESDTVRISSKLNTYELTTKGTVPYKMNNTSLINIASIVVDVDISRSNKETTVTEMLVETDATSPTGIIDTKKVLFLTAETASSTGISNAKTIVTTPVNIKETSNKVNISTESNTYTKSTNRLDFVNVNEFDTVTENIENSHAANKSDVNSTTKSTIQINVNSKYTLYDSTTGTNIVSEEYPVGKGKATEAVINSSNGSEVRGRSSTPDLDTSPTSTKSNHTESLNNKQDSGGSNIAVIAHLAATFVILIIIIIIIIYSFCYRRGSYVLPHTAEGNIEMEIKKP